MLIKKNYNMTTSRHIVNCVFTYTSIYNMTKNLKTLKEFEVRTVNLVPDITSCSSALPDEHVVCKLNT